MRLKGQYRQNYGFSSSHVWMWKLDHKEGWVLKNWYFQTVMLEKTLESPMDSKEIKPVNPKGNQPWIFFVRAGAEAETPIIWPPDAKSWLTGRDSDLGKDRRQERGATEDEMVGWHHRLNGHDWAISERWWWTGKPGGLQSMGSQVSGMTEQLDNNHKY